MIISWLRTQLQVLSAMKRKYSFTLPLLSVYFFSINISLIRCDCPLVPAEELFPCFCLHDTRDLICRGSDDRPITDTVLDRVTAIIKNNSKNLSFGKLTISQTDITSIGEKTFDGFAFNEVTIRFNFKLRFIHANAFEASRDSVKNISFGEIGSLYETQAMTPFDLSFLKGMNKLSNVFLSLLNIGHLEESIFKPYLQRGMDSKVRFYFIGLLFDCSCKIKWIMTSLNEEERKRSLLSPPSLSSARDYSPTLSCKSHKIPGLLVPLRALSLADFKDCP